MNNLVATLPKSLRSTGLGVAFTGFHSGQGPGAWHHTIMLLAQSTPDALTIILEFPVWTASMSVDGRREPAGACHLTINTCKIWMARPVLYIRHTWGAASGLLAGCSASQAE